MALKRLGIKRKPVIIGRRKRLKTTKRKRTQSDLKREWLIPVQSFHLRYSGLRGVYWYWLSREVRKEEWEKWEGKCLTCLVPLETWQEGQCGHVVPSSMCGEFLRLNKINLTIQHSKCNNPRFRPDAPALNAIHYDERFGQGAWQRLYDMRKTEAKEPRQEEYRNLIRSLSSYQEALKQKIVQIGVKEIRF